MDRLTEMEAFATVVEQGGFTDAAKKLALSKSAVSKHVSALEARLGARLLQRTTRRVTPTEVGLAYYTRARQVLQDAGDADAVVTAMQRAPSGLLRIVVIRDFGAAYMPDALCDFLTLYPNVSVQMTMGQPPADLEKEGFDLAIRIGAPEDNSLQIHSLAKTRQQLIASHAYLEQYGSPSRIDDLTDHRLLHDAGQTMAGGWELTAPSGEIRQIRSAARLSMDDRPSILKACKRGLGIAFLPDYICAAALSAGQVMRVLPQLPALSQDICAIYSPADIMQPKLHAFVDFLVQRLAENAAVTG